MVKIVLPASVLVCLAVSAGAAPGEETWSATSTTAMSITGGIVLSPSRIAFQGGASLPLAVAADVRAFGASGGPVAARILSVTRPSDPRLLNGNTLCGAPVRWLVVWRTADRGLGMAVFSGEKRPAGESDPGLCGDFFYDKG